MSARVPIGCCDIANAGRCVRVVVWVALRALAAWGKIPFRVFWRPVRSGEKPPKHQEMIRNRLFSPKTPGFCAKTVRAGGGSKSLEGVFHSTGPLRGFFCAGISRDRGVFFTLSLYLVRFSGQFWGCSCCHFVVKKTLA